MALVPGTRFGSCEVLALLGVGGMGEVYRGRDTRLDRMVAIKVLPQPFTDDVERLARFEREARTLASLNHPNIATIYGFEHVDGVRALVMELVEGPTLAERIARGPVPIEEALSIALQIAVALEAAHDQGFVHRDLKPANIKLRDDGTVKVLDFGLAKALEPPASPSVSQSPTITPVAMTQAGVVLGTAAYMAPEQAKGKPADRRSDVWGFGCVLYEMLAGRLAFGGDSVAEIVGAVLHTDPDWTRLPAATPGPIRTLVRRCLRKDRQQRLPDLGIARIEIQDTLSGSSADRLAAAAPARPTRERLAWAIATLSAAIVVAQAAMMWRDDPPPASPVYHSAILPVPEAPIIGLPPNRLALSPDGRHLAFTAGSTSSELWIRSLERGTVRRLAGTAGAASPFWSPDSRVVAFLADGRLKRIDIDGGPPVSLVDAKGATSGGSWSKDDVIVFSAGPNGALSRVSASGGVAQPATTLDAEAGDDRHWWPYFLPDGKHFLYEAVGTPSDRDDPRAVMVGSLDLAEPTRLLLDGGSNAKYAQGHVLYMRDRTLVAQRFDPTRVELIGPPRPLAENIAIGGSTGQSGAFSVSATGVLAYQTETGEVGSQLAWFDRAGKQIGVVGDKSSYRYLQLSPNATRALVSLPRGVRTLRDIWIVDLVRGTKTPFTPGERAETAAVWSPDGARIAFNGGRSGPGGEMTLYVKSANGAGSEEVLVEDPMNKVPFSWSHDGRFLVYSARGKGSASDLWVVPLSGGQKPIPFMRTSFNENAGRFSPDDRWIAYSSDDSGKQEVYIAPFPETGARWPVSIAGGLIGSAKWRFDGRELFYVAPDWTLMAAEIDGRGGQIKLGRVSRLFKLSGMPEAPGTGPSYDVAPDGRFLIAVNGDEARPAPVFLVINWTERLRGE